MIDGWLRRIFVVEVAMAVKCSNCGSLDAKFTGSGWECSKCKQTTPDPVNEVIPEFVCSRCHATTTKLVTDWSMVGGIGCFTLILLWILFAVVLGLTRPLAVVATVVALLVIIALSATASHTTVCIVCGSSDLIPGDSPKGWELLREDEEH